MPDAESLHRAEGSEVSEVCRMPILCAGPRDLGCQRYAEYRFSAQDRGIRGARCHFSAQGRGIMGGYTSRLGFTVGGFCTLRLSEALSTYKVYIYIYILEARGRYAPHPAARRYHVAIVSCHEAKARDAPER